MNNNMPTDGSLMRAFTRHCYGGRAPVELVNPKPPNGRSQKTARKARRSGRKTKE